MDPLNDYMASGLHHEHRQELLATASAERLVAQARSGQPSIVGLILYNAGRRLEGWGHALQARYAPAPRAAES